MLRSFCHLRIEGEHPDVARTRGIEIAGAVHAIDGTRDYAYIALVFGIEIRGLARALFARGLLVGGFAGSGFRLGLALGLAFGLGRALALALFAEVVGIGVAAEGDVGAIGRPHRIARAARERGERLRFTAAEREIVELRPARAASGFFRGAREREILAIGRPARRAVTLAAGERLQRAAGGGDAPDGGVVAVLLLVDGDPDKRDARAVGRNLRVADPDELEEIFFCDGALLCVQREGAGDKQGNSGDAENVTAHRGPPKRGGIYIRWRENTADSRAAKTIPSGARDPYLSISCWSMAPSLRSGCLEERVPTCPPPRPRWPASPSSRS